MIPEHILEEAAVHYLIEIGQNPLEFVSEIGLQPIRIRKIMASRMMREMLSEAPATQRLQAKKPIHVDRTSSTWRTKMVAGIAMLAALGLGSATIARMVRRPEPEVKAVIDMSQDQIKRLQEVGRERKNEPTKYPLSDRKQVAQTQEQLWFTRILFSEAANQPLRAKEAVAQVIMNRVKSGRYPNTVIGVIGQRSQFSGLNGRLWKMSEKPDEMNPINRRAYLQCSDVANRALNGQLPNHVGSATLYHDHSISMPWNPNKVRLITQIGNFSFYQEIR